MSSSQTQQALVLKSKDTPLSLENVPIPTAVPGATIIKILGSSLNPMARGVLTEQIPFPHIFPLIPGMTAIGRVSDVGPDSTSLTKDQLVFVSVHVRSRDDPDANILLGWFGGMDPGSQKLMDGEWRNGTLAEYTKVPLESVYPLNEDLLVKQMGYRIADLNWLGPLTVPAGGLMEIDVCAGETVVVAPASGFFSGAAVHMALGMGARVIAAARNEKVLSKMAETFKSTERFVPVILKSDIEADAAAIRTAAGGKGADAYIDFSPPAAPKSTHLQACIMALRPFGRVALMGGVFSNVEVPYGIVMWNSIRIQGRYMFDREHALRVIKLVETRMLKLGPGENSGIQAETFKYKDVEKALDKTEGGKWGSHVVMEP